MKKLVPTLAALLVMFAAVRLGIWQLERAEYKQALLAAWGQAPAVRLDRVDTDTPQFARIEGRGRFDHQRHILLDNQTLDGRHGVHVFTPFQPEGAAGIFLVNRGWLPFSTDPADPPRTLPRDIVTPDGALEIRGRLNDPPRVGARLGSASALDADRWPNLMTYFDLERIREALGPEVNARIVQLDAAHPAGFEGRHWPVVSLGPERHRAYAFQWFAIALAVFIIWLVLFIRSLGR